MEKADRARHKTQTETKQYTKEKGSLLSSFTVNVLLYPSNAIIETGSYAIIGVGQWFNDDELGQS